MLRVVSYNIHKGFTRANRRFILKEMRDALHEVHPDLVFLQEVLGRHDRHQKKIPGWPSESQFEFLAHRLWPHYTYGKNAVYSSGHHGNAVLSKFPITFWENIDVSTNRFEKRGLLHSILNIPGISRPFHLICLHLGLLPKDRLVQIQKLCERIESHVPHEEPVIIAGDFNDWNLKASQVLRKSLDVSEAFLEMNGIHAKTYPSWLPALCLDRIYFRGLKVRHAKCLNEKPWSELSDHVALYAEFRI